ncbi:Hypothetical protein, putative [Bodo saltans]|uniref:Uncharacterized protein n=1 Tax=Bodo saltans TaxID=75058 RepID=A0A0S4JEJ2_BODSA|nr:Hypothetical protein, putative [Bodo saltans]|eukprot:CUG89908.1 Hypothetical protein, putative [Bodo saltans]
MLEQRLSETCDAIARSHVMRVLDTHEAAVLLSGKATMVTSNNSDSEVLRVFRARERWRLSKESVELTKLQRLVTDAKFHVHVKKEWSMYPMLRDASDEAAAASVGLIYKSSVNMEGTLLYQDDFAKLLEGSQSTAILKRCESKQVTSSEGFTAATLLEKMTPLETSETTNASLRDLLLTTSHQLRSFAWLWQRQLAAVDDGVTGILVPGVFHAAFAKFLTPKREEIQDLLTGAAASAVASSSSLARNDDDPASSLIYGRNKCSQPWTPQQEEKWRKHLHLVVRLQACARRLIAVRRHRPSIAKRIANKRLKRYQRVEKQLVPNALQYLRQTQPVAEAYHRVVRKIEADQAELEDFYAQEENVFQQQWNQYVRKMTNFFMNECPLDQDWLAQRDPVTQAIVFLNMKTGRTQTENPNALKVVAAKNREWMKATRERQVRLARASIATERVNHLKTKLVELTKRLEAPVFL